MEIISPREGNQAKGRQGGITGRKEKIRGGGYPLKEGPLEGNSRELQKRKE